MLDWQQLVRRSDEELARLDIAEVHLSCAQGLPGAEKIDYTGCLRKLDGLAAWVRDYTAHCLRKLGRGNCQTENQHRMMCLGTCLWQGAGICYNPERIAEGSPWEFDDAWIHGALLGPGGTCATLPVVYTAIGRRLGYPLKLVTSWGPRYYHLFCRWDDPGRERFNVEANYTGVSFPEDAHYWRRGPGLEQELAGRFLRSMTPREELADFMNQRAYFWDRACNWRRGMDALAWACALSPANRDRLQRLRNSCEAWGMFLQERSPPGFPPLELEIAQRRYPETLPREVEALIVCLEMKENLLRDEESDRLWWDPLRRRQPGVRPPRQVTVASRMGGFEFAFRF